MKIMLVTFFMFYYFYDYMLTIFTLKFEKTLYKETL